MWKLFVSLVLLSVVYAQRGSYAGVRPIMNGIKGPFPTQQSGLNNRFGDDVDQKPLPVDALGSYDLVNRLSQRPYYQQPFWLLNYEAIEAHRNQPQPGVGPFANRGSFQGRKR